MRRLYTRLHEISRSFCTPGHVTGRCISAPSPSTARAQSKPTTGARDESVGPPRVEFIAISANDALLEQVGQALDGESAIRQVDSVEAAHELIRGASCCVVLLEIPPRGDAAALVRELAPSDLSVIVVFAHADETATVARAITATATFAVLPVPIEIAKTAAVLEGARDEALSRHSLLAQHELNAAAAWRLPQSGARTNPVDRQHLGSRRGDCGSHAGRRNALDTAAQRVSPRARGS
jgi:hypothetical protein